METIYITTDADGCAAGASRIAGAYAVPFTATGETWALGIERVYVAFGPDSKTVVAAFGTKDDLAAYFAATGNTDTGRVMVDHPARRAEVAA